MSPKSCNSEVAALPCHWQTQFFPWVSGTMATSGVRGKKLMLWLKNVSPCIFLMCCNYLLFLDHQLLSYSGVCVCVCVCVFFSFWVLVFFYTGSCYVAQDDLTLSILLPQPPKHWNHRCAPPQLATRSFLSTPSSFLSTPSAACAQ
jgi:hypothetical protein